MIAELKELIHKVEQLTEDKQHAIVNLINDEFKWDNTFQTTQHKLASLAQEAIEEYKLGKTKRQDW